MTRRLTFLVFALFMLGTVAMSRSGFADPESTGALATYTVIAVKAFTVYRSPLTEDCPRGLDTLMQERAVGELRKKRVFARVVDLCEPMAAPAAAHASADSSRTSSIQASTDTAATGRTLKAETPGGRRVILGGSIMVYERSGGSARFLSRLGAGQTRIMAQYTLTDAQSGREIANFDQDITCAVPISVFGAGDDTPTAAVREAVKTLIGELVSRR